MISAGVEGRLPYMTYPEPWRGPPKQPPELFLRPAPKNLPSTTRYNGVNTTTYPNGTRLAHPARPISKYPSPPSIPNAVNLAQTKEDVSEEMSPFSPYRMFTSHVPQFTHFPLPPVPTTLHDETKFPSYASLALRNSSVGETRTEYFKRQEDASTAFTFSSPPPPPPPHNHVAAFKVPSGKEGSLKHRILTRPEDSVRGGPLDLQKAPEARKRLQATLSPPRSPKKTVNNNTLSGSFAKGSLIKLHNGELRRIEDMRTEDFVMSAERSPELRLAESTVVKIDGNQQTGNATITLSYNQRRAQVEVEATTEHPFFVMGHGWASCNPERTQQVYGLKAHRLQVGDILISLTPREPAAPCPPSKAGSTIITTATTTSMTARQVSANSASTCHVTEPVVSQTHPMNLHLATAHALRSMSPDSEAARKRRWSAPDQICDEEEQNNARRRR
ncbi:hypothetical protein NQ317_005755, partial [Molorchus minor]